jgi:hypothetical protein
MTIASGTAITWNVLYGSHQVELQVGGLRTLVPGDYDGDDDVDAADYVLWRRLLNTNVLAADGNQDGQINSDDYAVWRADFGQVNAGSGTSTSVPEPPVLMTFVAGALAIFTIRSRYVQAYV